MMFLVSDLSNPYNHFGQVSLIVLDGLLHDDVSLEIYPARVDKFLEVKCLFSTGLIVDP